MRQLGTAKKLFHELVHGDKLYYIDPKTPHEISELTIKETRKAVDPRFIVIVYFKSDEATKAITDMSEYKVSMPGVDTGINLLDTIPVGKLVVAKNASDCMTHTLPPSVYFTNKRALEKFMGK